MKTKTFTFLAVLCIAQLSYAQANWEWAKKINSNAGVEQSYITTDQNNNVYMGGYFTGSSLVLGADTLNHFSNNGSMQLFLSKYDSAGNVLWAATVKDSFDVNITGIATDKENNVYIIGTGMGKKIIFGNDTLDADNNDYNTFLAKYDSLGNFIWAKVFQSNGGAFGGHICIDQNNNVIIAGRVFAASWIIFGTDILYPGYVGFIVVKFDSAGNTIWANQINRSTAYDYINGITTDKNDNIYFTGDYNGSLTVFGTDTLTNKGTGPPYDNGDVFIVKYDSAGNNLWAKSFGGSKTDVGNGITVGNNGQLYVTGYFESPEMIIGTNTLRNAGSKSKKMFLARYDTAGNAIWAKTVKDTTNTGTSVKIGNNGDIYVAGNFSGDTLNIGSYSLLNKGNSDIYIAKYSQAGNALDASSAGGNMDDISYDLALDNNEDGYIVGYYNSNPINFGNLALAHNGSGDNVYLAKFNALTLSIERNRFDNKLLVFPNPFSIQTTIKTAKPLKDATLAVYDILGQKVKQINHISGNKIILQRGNLPEGIYFIQLNEDNKVLLTKKVVITN